MKRFLFIFFFFLMLPITVTAAEVKFGLLPRLPEKEMIEMFNPLAKYLEKETGYKITLIVPKDFDTFTQMAIAGDFHIGFANPYIYILIKKSVKDVEPLVMASEKDTGTKLKGVFIALKDSPINSVKDLKGKKISFADPGSAAGYIAQMLVLQKAGIKKEDITITFAGKPPLVGEAVRDKKVDAGGMPEPVFKKLPYEHMLKVIGSTDELPNWPVFTTKKTEAVMSAKIKEALLKLKPSIKTVPILGIAKIEGFVPTTDKDFDLMREAASAARAF